MSASMTACGGDDKSSGNSDGDGKTGASTGSGKDGSSQAASPGLPEASDMASIAYFLNKYTPCLDLKPGAQYDEADEYDRHPAWGDEDMAKEPKWGIKERAACVDNYSHANTLLLLSDMKKFQTAFKEAEYKNILVGKDFAVDPSDAQSAQALKASGLVTLSCDSDGIPSGFKQEPAQVDGCVLTNYYAN
ncbi:hypothetical protein [Streptomyces sp. NPDC050121]|uniref:hypothetical protein n=1 Tax=Streptomyces sp. NPDC050121 TaxID=3365601 RepID=UPI00379B8652